MSNLRRLFMEDAGEFLVNGGALRSFEFEELGLINEVTCPWTLVVI